MKKPHKREVERTCIATGTSGNGQTLLRFVIGPDGAVAPDFSGKLPGRGAWVTPTREALEEVIAKGAFARSYKAAAVVPDGLADQVEAGLVTKALSSLGMARKTGDALAGFEKVRSALKAQEVGVLIAASDGAADGRRKLAGLAKDVPLIEVFTGSELSAALGRDEAVHVAIEKGASAKRFLSHAMRAKGFRSAPEAAGGE